MADHTAQDGVSLPVRIMGIGLMLFIIAGMVYSFGKASGLL